MNRTIRILGLAAVVAVAGTAGWSAVAQTAANDGHGHGTGKPGMMMGMGGGHGPAAAHAPARLAALKADLGITAEQQPAWDAYAKVVTDTAASMQSQHAGMDMSAMRGLSEQERSTRMDAMHSQHETAQQTVKAAAETLLAALDETQKTKAKDLLPGLAAHGSETMQNAAMGMHGMHGMQKRQGSH